MEATTAVIVFVIILAAFAAATWGVPYLRREKQSGLEGFAGATVLGDMSPMGELSPVKENYGPPPGTTPGPHRAGAPSKARGYTESAGSRAHGGHTGVVTPGGPYPITDGLQGGHVRVLRSQHDAAGPEPDCGALGGSGYSHSDVLGWGDYEGTSVEGNTASSVLHSMALTAA